MPGRLAFLRREAPAFLAFVNRVFLIFDRVGAPHKRRRGEHMSRKFLATLTALVAIAALAFAATATSSGSATQSRAGVAATGSTQQIGMMNVRFTIQKFVRRGRHLYAVGTTTAKFTPDPARSDLPTATSSKRFSARVRSIKAVNSAQR